MTSAYDFLGPRTKVLVSVKLLITHTIKFDIITHENTVKYHIGISIIFLVKAYFI